jgi:hypothetical protein
VHRRIAATAVSVCEAVDRRRAVPGDGVRRRRIFRPDICAVDLNWTPATATLSEALANGRCLTRLRRCRSGDLPSARCIGLPPTAVFVLQIPGPSAPGRRYGHHRFWR